MKEINSGRLLAFLAITATVIFWGLSYICTKNLLTAFTPFQIAACRYSITVIILLLGGCITRRLRPISRRDLPRLIAAGFIGIFIYFILENSGLKLTTAGMTSMIIATVPVLNTMIASVFLKQPASLRIWVGVTLSVVGVAVVVGGAEFSISSMWGNFLIFGAALTWVGYTLLNQPLSQKYDAFSINTYQAIVGAVLLLILALHEGEALPKLTGGMIGNFLFLSLCCSALGYIFYTYALKNLGATIVTTFINFIPVLGVLGGVVILGEPLSWLQIIGGIIILLGVTLVSQKKYLVTGSNKHNFPLAS